jgi:hypothetical protein
MKNRAGCGFLDENGFSRPGLDRDSGNSVPFQDFFLRKTIPTYYRGFGFGRLVIFGLDLIVQVNHYLPQ